MANKKKTEETENPEITTEVVEEVKEENVSEEAAGENTEIASEAQEEPVEDSEAETSIQPDEADENSEVTTDAEARMKKLQEEMSEDEQDPVVDDGMEEVEGDDLEAYIANAVRNALENTRFDKRRVHMVTDKKTKKELYAETERIVDFKGRIAKTDAEERQEEINVLRDAARSVPPKIMHGKITGLEITENNFMLANVNASGLRGEISIKIPVGHLFAFNEKDYANEQGVEYLRNEVMSRINSEIYFVVYQVHEELGIALASRLAAMELQGRMNYIKLRSDGYPRHFEGVLAEAKVIAVRKDRVRIEVGGVETTIKSGRELSWTSLMDCREEFHIGDKFMVKILKVGVEEHIVKDRTFNLVKIRVSKAAAEKDPKLKYFDQFKEGQIVAGIIKTESSAKGVFVTVQNKMDVLCTVPNIGKAVPGKECTVRIMKKNEEKKQLIGRILQIAR